MRKRNITKIGEIQERSIKGKNKKKKKTERKEKEKQNVRTIQIRKEKDD